MYVNVETSAFLNLHTFVLFLQILFLSTMKS